MFNATANKHNLFTPIHAGFPQSSGNHLMISYRELEKGIMKLGLSPSHPVIIHVARDPFESIKGGVETLLGALTANTYAVVTPAFTYRTMLIPEKGPPDNGITYGSGRQANEMVEAFDIRMPPDEALGDFPRVFSRLPGVERSKHPILSFFGLHSEEYLSTQTLSNPLAVIENMMANDGQVVLINVDHTANTSIHLGELMANRKTFVRWALTENDLVECANFPGCSFGFNAISSSLEPYCGSLGLAGLEIKALPLRDLISVVCNMIQKDPSALLCQRPDCERCNALRK
ncbi:MAG: AAC(3) family N-acetyltransferase [Anaerolineaceae bacterium]|nr:AAC(3) family N-acetyltransferase [Anaerolineaceae bacterium]